MVVQSYSSQVWTGSDGTGCFRTKVRTDTAEVTDMRIARIRK